MSDLARLKIDLDRAFETKVIGGAVALQKKLALEALRRVVLKSPVDTGRFRGNWQVAIGVRPNGVVETVDPSGGATIANGTRPISALDQLDVVYLVNNLPYAQRLEDGYSGQAPQGMVAVTVAEINAFFGDGA